MNKFLKDLKGLESYVLSELNVRELKLSEDEESFGITYRVTPNFKELGQRLSGDFGAIQAALKKLTKEDLKIFLSSGKLSLLGHTLTNTDLEVHPELALADSHCEKDFAIILDTSVDESLKEEGLSRDLVNRIQRLRKKANLKPTDSVCTIVQVEGDLRGVLERQIDYLTKALKDVKISSSVGTNY